jgi:hypothetical protein
MGVSLITPRSKAVEGGKNRGRAARAVLLRRCGDLGLAEGGHDLLRESNG